MVLAAGVLACSGDGTSPTTGSSLTDTGLMTSTGVAETTSTGVAPTTSSTTGSTGVESTTSSGTTTGVDPTTDTETGGAVCGNGQVEAGEACDDGDADNTDACLDTCVAASCGDGHVGPGEGCDDGNDIDDDACSNACAPASCGDGQANAGEDCDDGNADDTDACLSTCVAAGCGDGKTWAGHEDCDDADDDDTDDCLDTCKQASCGDGKTWAGHEACDDGNADDSDTCLATCVAASCGDGIVGPGEGCDDGNDVVDDGCDNCVPTSCGDGKVTGGEACDDGNADNTDACLDTCAPATCGDGFTWTGHEACDDGDADNTDDCLDTCAAATCGDGHTWAGHEACDDGNADDTDDCVDACAAATCGDGHAWTGHEACDDGNADDTDACVDACAAATCGDGHTWTGHEACDDGNAVEDDGCTSACTVPICQDLLDNGDETDVDCGGSCLDCPVGLDCEGADDCLSGVCELFECVDACTQWLRQLGSTKDDRIYAIAVDAADNLVAAGPTSGGLDGNLLLGSSDVVVMKYSVTGTKLWLRQPGSTGLDNATGVATDAAGYIFVTGFTTASFDGNIAAGGWDIFLLKYDPDGTKLWTRQIGSTQSDFPTNVATDGDGNAIIVGQTPGNLDGHVQAGAGDAFILKYDTDGNKLWSRQFGTSAVDELESVATDGAGNIVVTGNTAGGFDGHIHAGARDLIVAKFSPAGAKLWTRQVGTNDSDFGEGVATDKLGNVIVTGTAYKSLDLQPYLGGGDVVVIKYTPAGAKLWTRMYGTSLGEDGREVATDSANNIYVTGYTSGSLGGNNLGLQDIFVTLFSPGGTRHWTRQRGTNKQDIVNDIVITSKGSPALAAHTEGSFGPVNQGSFDLVLTLLCQP